MNSSNQMAWIVKDEAQLLLKPHKQVLQQCILSAHKSWENLMAVPEVCFGASKRTRASMIYDFMCINVHAEYDGRGKEGIYVSDKPGFVLLTITDLDTGNGVALRFKKINRGLRCSNIMTQQQLGITNQDPIDGMPGKLPILTVGYLLDITEAAIKDMAVTFWLKNRLVWAFSIMGAAAEIVPLPSILVEPTLRPRATPDKAKRPIVTSKKAKENKKTGSE